MLYPLSYEGGIVENRRSDAVFGALGGPSPTGLGSAIPRKSRGRCSMKRHFAALGSTDRTHEDRGYSASCEGSVGDPAHHQPPAHAVLEVGEHRVRGITKSLADHE